MTANSLIRLPIHYPHRGAVLANARADGSTLSLFAPGTAVLPIGTLVHLQISFGDVAARFELEGTVSFLRRVATSPRHQPGLGFTFAGPQKRDAAHMLAACAGRPIDEGTALGPRHPVRVVCLVHHRGIKLRAELRDLSASGAFVCAGGLPGLKEDDEVTISLQPLFGRWGGRALQARVIWVGAKRGGEGFGVRFVGDAALIRACLKKHLPAR